MEGDYLIISDVDGTLLGDDEALRRFAAWYDVQRGSIRLAYNSGRFFQSVVDVIKQTALPEPDVIVGGVGTQIRRFADGEDCVHGWPGDFVQWNREVIASRLQQYQQLEPQPDDCQAEFKLSYYAYDLDPELLDRLATQLAAANQQVELVYSSSRDLDVLPAGINKGSAAAQLASSAGFQPRQVLVCGDTGNDKAMFAHGFRGVVVGNAEPELRQIQGPTIYHARAGYAAGVLEGIEHWMAEMDRAAADRAAGA